MATNLYNRQRITKIGFCFISVECGWLCTRNYVQYIFTIGSKYLSQNKFCTRTKSVYQNKIFLVHLGKFFPIIWLLKLEFCLFKTINIYNRRFHFLRHIQLNVITKHVPPQYWSFTIYNRLFTFLICNLFTTINCNWMGEIKEFFHII